MTAAKILLAAATDWPFPARLAFGLTELGARVDGLCLKRSPLHRSRAPARLHGFSPLRPLGSLAAAITASAPELVIACDDLMTELLWRLAQARPEFDALVRRSFGNSEALPVLASRNAFLCQAAAAGAPVADTMALHDAADLDMAMAKLGLPLVLKADGSWGGNGVVVVRDRQTAHAELTRLSRSGRLRAVTRALLRREPHLLARARFAAPPRLGAQRFVSGHPATSAIACWEGRLLAANHFDVVVANGTGPATVVARTDCAQMQASAQAIAAHFGLSGLHGLDYMRDGMGRVFLLEINPRATPTSHLALGAGHDLAAALLRAAGHDAPDRSAVSPRALIALFPQEMRRDPQSPHLTGAYHDLPRDDPGLMGETALTSFSRDFSGLSTPEQACKSLGR